MSRCTLTYTYLQSELGNFLEDTRLDAGLQALFKDQQFIKHSGAAYSIFQFKDGWFTTLSYSANLTEAYNFGLYEFGFGKELKLTASSLTLSGKLSRQHRPYGFPFNNSPNAFFFNARLAF